jgi:hypothetical protein
MFSKIIDGDNGRVVQFGNDLGFALETEAELGVKGKLAGQHFDGNFPAHKGIGSQVNDSHATASKFILYYITADFFWYHKLDFTSKKIMGKIVIP